MSASWPKRIFLFVAVNILVVLTISFLLNILGVQPYLNQYGLDYESLAAFCLVWGMGGAFISLGLSKIMAKMMMGVKIIPEDSMDSDHRWLLSTVYRLAQAAEIQKMPEVGVYESPELNAFATGPTRNNSLVAVSSGLLHSMNKEEVEGVLSHEVAHIANGDMVTMTLLQGVINAFVMFLARVIAFAISNSRDSDNRSRHSNYWLVMLLEMVLSFFGMMVVAWFSRFREFRADAGGAQLGGRSNMIKGLRRLQSYQQSLQGGVPTSQDSFNTMKISGRKGFFSLFATHPDLSLRIARLEESTSF